MRWSSAVVLLLVGFGCSEATLTSPPGSTPPDPTTDSGSESNDDGAAPEVDGGRADGAAHGTANIRIMAGNLTSGDASKYDSGEGIRMFQGLHPDIAMIQEFKYKTNAKAELDEFVSVAFGPDYQYTRESGGPALQIPNGLVSRFPILASGRWVDPEATDRGFAYAKIDIPGPHDLWAVSVHLLTKSAGQRAVEANALVSELNGVMAKNDYLVVGGDFNTATRTEECISNLGGLFDIEAAPPADQKGNDNTNRPRNAPYDWVLASPALSTWQVPTVIGASVYPSGLVFDSGVYTPLSEVAPVKLEDSAAVNMQHMPVVKDFAVPE